MDARVETAGRGFNSRTPGGVRRRCLALYALPLGFQFTHPGRGATTSKQGAPYCVTVSIHAPREGCDFREIMVKLGIYRFNSRTPGGVRHLRTARVGSTSRCFNSRTPGGVRREARRYRGAMGAFQFTHPGRGATDTFVPFVRFVVVSIHAPREGCDRSSPPPQGQRPRVSIHAPREGCDDSWTYGGDLRVSFNSRTPGGVRLIRLFIKRLASTVSIHAPREGCD